jgi:hypothetical protein
MAKLARDYHENLQNNGISHTESREEHNQKTTQLLQVIPNAQKLNAPELSPLYWETNGHMLKGQYTLQKRPPHQA